MIRGFPNTLKRMPGCLETQMGLARTELAMGFGIVASGAWSFLALVPQHH